LIDAVEREGRELFTIIIKMKQGEKQGECREVPSEKELSFVRLAAPALSLSLHREDTFLSRKEKQ